jgi:hypothetical protein
VYELRDGEALLIEVEVPVTPAYSGIHLANLWGESHDYANRVTSLNGFQSEASADGRLRYVVAHRDPGVPNWLDTGGRSEGYALIRWVLPATLPPNPDCEVIELA